MNTSMWQLLWSDMKLVSTENYQHAFPFFSAFQTCRLYWNRLHHQRAVTKVMLTTSGMKTSLVNPWPPPAGVGQRSTRARSSAATAI
ncbi:hypothetical protein V5799_006301 [Amblyomma americanum]|uniref:Uncharacterized protein n=1 Tax=Amblyomma americanum TaxID=6943 RepID=A0AAQ4DWS7_AMBAM